MRIAAGKGFRLWVKDYLSLLALGLLSVTTLCVWIGVILSLSPAFSWASAFARAFSFWTPLSGVFILLWAFGMVQNVRRILPTADEVPRQPVTPAPRLRSTTLPKRRTLLDKSATSNANQARPKAPIA